MSGVADVPSRAGVTYRIIQLASQLLDETLEQRVHPWPVRLANRGSPHLPPLN